VWLLPGINFEMSILEILQVITNHLRQHIPSITAELELSRNGYQIVINRDSLLPIIIYLENNTRFVTSDITYELLLSDPLLLEKILRKY